MDDAELREQIATVLFDKHLNSCDEGCGWTLEDEKTSETTDELTRLMKARDAAVRIDELSMLGRLPLNNNQLEKVVHRIDMLKKEFRTSDHVRSKEEE